jgi:hypothetical protein
MSDNQNPNGAPRPLPEAASKSQKDWREYCAQLLAEIEGLHTLIAELREEKRAYASMIPVSEEDKQLLKLPVEQLQAMCADGSIEDLLRELESGK